jgi:predicted transcriptional regulator
MTLTLSFPPDVEARLRQQAAALGKDVETVVREAVEAKLAEIVAGIPSIPTDRWQAEFDAWVAGHDPVSHTVDDSRESIYAGRGE